MSITITDTNVTIKSAAMHLAEVDAAISAVELGKSYSIAGSRSQEFHSLDELYAAQEYWTARVLEEKGAISANVSDFSGGIRR